jgi:hypothetical protein
VDSTIVSTARLWQTRVIGRTGDPDRKERRMYGTIYRMKVKPGEEERADEVGRRWLRERAPAVAGFIGEYRIKSTNHPGEWVGLAIFDSEENYRKNADDPEQDRWHRELRATLEADPDWFDGEIVSADEIVAL